MAIKHNPNMEDQVEALLRKTLGRHMKPEAPVGGAEVCAKGVYLIAFADRSPAWVFVPDPTKRGRFCRVPRGFLFYGCPACGALPGQPCHNPRHATSWSGQTGHADRISDRGRNYPTYDNRGSRDEDVLQEAALVALARQVQFPGVTITVEHLRNCPAYGDKSDKKQCDCEQEARDKMLRRTIKQLPAGDKR
jgi:hypothetical protein